MAGELVEHTKVAFQYIQRLYNETAMLIREVELLLAEEPESLKIGRPSGYGITVRKATGLAATDVQQWPRRRLAVFFTPEPARVKGHTDTPLGPDCRVMYLRFVLDRYEHTEFAGKALSEPAVFFGVLWGVHSPNNKVKKFEQCMTNLEYIEHKLMRELPNVDIEDNACSMQGRLSMLPLFDLVDVGSVAQLLVKPWLAMYRDSALGPASSTA